MPVQYFVGGGWKKLPETPPFTNAEKLAEALHDFCREREEFIEGKEPEATTTGAQFQIQSSNGRKFEVQVKEI